MLRGSSTLSEFWTSLSKVLTLWHCFKVKQRYHSNTVYQQYFYLMFVFTYSKEYLCRLVCTYIWPPPPASTYSADTTHPSTRKIGQWWLPSFSPSLLYAPMVYLLSNYHGSSFPRLLQAKWETLNDYPRGFGGWWQLTEKNGPEHVVFAFTLLKTGSNIRKTSPIPLY